MVPRRCQRCRYTNRSLKENIPNNKIVEFNLRHLRISVLVQRRFNVERGEHTSDDKVHGLETKASTGTDPRGYEHDYSW